MKRQSIVSGFGRSKKIKFLNYGIETFSVIIDEFEGASDCAARRMKFSSADVFEVRALGNAWGLSNHTGRAFGNDDRTTILVLNHPMSRTELDDATVGVGDAYSIGKDLGDALDSKALGHCRT